MFTTHINADKQIGVFLWAQYELWVQVDRHSPYEPWKLDLKHEIVQYSFAKFLQIN